MRKKIVFDIKVNARFSTRLWRQVHLQAHRPVHLEERHLNTAHLSICKLIQILICNSKFGQVLKLNVLLGGVRGFRRLVHNV